MTERIDHYAAAVSMLKDAEMSNGVDLIAAIVQGAQVHATLALAEQQRIANLIALHQEGFASSALTTSQWATVLTEIKEGLGL
jgi:hypothetical protein